MGPDADADADTDGDEAAGFDRRTVEANGIAFECLRAGDGDRLALCLHGFPDDAGTMAPLLARLPEAGFTAVAPYMRGYAPTESAPDGDYSTAALGADAVALAAVLRDELDVDEAVLVGHDWGAAAAYAADRFDPAAFDRMVAMAVPPGFDALLLEYPTQVLRSWYMWFFQLPGLPERALAWRDYELIELLWGLWSPGWDYPHARIAAVTETFATGDTTANALAYYRDTVGSSMDELLEDGPPSLTEVPPVQTPTLVVCGGTDGCIGPELFAHADAVIEDCRVVRVRDAGHFMHQERPDVVGDEVREWLEVDD